MQSLLTSPPWFWCPPKSENLWYCLRVGLSTGVLWVGASGIEPAWQCRILKRLRFDPWLRKVSWRRKWKIPCAEELGGLWSMRSRRVGHDWVTEHRSVHLSPSPHCLCLHPLAQNTCSCTTLPSLVCPVALRHPSESQLRSHPCKPEGLSLCFRSPAGLCSRHPMRITRACGLLNPWPRDSDQASFRQAWAPVSVYYLLALVIVVQSLSCVRLFSTIWTVACQASLSFTVSQSLLKLMSIELIMPSHMYQTFNDIGYGT